MLLCRKRIRSFSREFDRELIHSVIPYVEEEFRTIRNRSGRAIAGLSLGSAQATMTAGKHQELFSALGVFSGAGLHVFEEFQEAWKQNMLIFLSCGDKEKEILEQQTAWQKKLQEKGNQCIQKTYESYHEWKVWRESLYDFAQLLFPKIEDEESNIIQKEKVTHVSEIYKEQFMEESMMFFDPVYKQVYFATDENGNPAGR